MPTTVFQQDVDVTQNISILTPAKIMHQTRQFNSSLPHSRFESMKVIITNASVVASKDDQEVDLESSNFEVLLQLIPCAQTAIRDEKHKCKLKLYKEVDLVKLKKKRTVLELDRRGPLVLRAIIRDEDPKNPLPAEDLKGFRVKLRYSYTIEEVSQPITINRGQTKTINELKSKLNSALDRIKKLSKPVAVTSSSSEENVEQ